MSPNGTQIKEVNHGGKIYQILTKHKLPLKKREEVLTDLLLLFDVSVSVCEHNYKPKKATKGVNYCVCTKCGKFNPQTDL